MLLTPSPAFSRAKCRQALNVRHTHLLMKMGGLSSRNVSFRQAYPRLGTGSGGGQKSASPASSSGVGSAEKRKPRGFVKLNRFVRHQPGDENQWMTRRSTKLGIEAEGPQNPCALRPTPQHCSTGEQCRQVLLLESLTCTAAGKPG